MTTHGIRSRLPWLLPCVATVATLLSARFAQADLAFVISDASGNTNFTNVQPGSSYNLIIYALVQDANGTTVGTSGDWFSQAGGGVQVADTVGTMVASGDVSFPNNPASNGGNGWGNPIYPTGFTGSTNTVALWSSGGSIGIGCSSTVSSSESSQIFCGLGGAAKAWKTTTPGGVPNPPASIISAYPTYTVYPFAEFTMSFGTPSLPSGATASVNFIPGTASSPPLSWYENTTVKSADGNGLFTGLGHGSFYAGTLGNYMLDTVTFSTSSAGGGTTWFTGAADLSGVAANPSGGLWVGVPPPSTATIVFSGGTTTVSGVITNTTNPGLPGGDTQDLVNWKMAASGQVGGTLSAASQTGGPIAAGGNSGAVSFTYSANSTFFGPDAVILTATGTNQNLLTSATTAFPGGLQAAINVIGLAQKPAGTYGTVGVYGPQLVSASGTNLAGMETTLSNVNTYGIGSTYALILAGNNPIGTPVSMAWRSRTSNELPVNAILQGGPAKGFLPLFSDVVNITGIGSPGVSNTANAFALEMSYDPSQVGDEAQAASGGFLYLGYRTSSGSWANAVTADTTPQLSGGTAITNFQGGWSAFTQQEDLNGGFPADAPAHTLAQLLGSWGVDTANHTVWAVVDTDAEFAVVPEPGTLALLAVGAAALGVAYRRRKVAKS